MSQATPAKSGTALSAQDLRALCDPAMFAFDTTAGLDPLPSLIGQDRALQAIRLAAGIRHDGFNLFVFGPEGTGRHSIVRRILEEEAASRPEPLDWVYVNNFDEPHRPKAISLPPGTARRLKTAMDDLVDDLVNDIPALFESEEYQNRRRVIEQRFASRHETAFANLNEKALQRSVAILRTPMGFAIAATKDGEVVKPDAFAKLSKADRAKIDKNVAKIQKDLEKFLKSIPRMEKEHRQAAAELNIELAERAVENSFSEALTNFGQIEALKDHFEALRSDLVHNTELFLRQGNDKTNGLFPVAANKVLIFTEN